MVESEDPDLLRSALDYMTSVYADPELSTDKFEICHLASRQPALYEHNTLVTSPNHYCLLCTEYLLFSMYIMKGIVIFLSFFN